MICPTNQGRLLADARKLQVAITSTGRGRSRPIDSVMAIIIALPIAWTATIPHRPASRRGNPIARP